jgi:hypothetical protein
MLRGQRTGVRRMKAHEGRHRIFVLADGDDVVDIPDFADLVASAIAGGTTVDNVGADGRTHAEYAAKDRQ